ncbi:hypothetical protein SAMN05443669_100214 [Flavobacterium xanthum]|uniref:Uncharacterized protein n=1 Tax=Flavobacterium xanthum TaxID=69322 RepID=A0A1M6XQL3_9FLAO|nr:hypothetical protein SAMN05443669_100214 [Flavobacterium xanthum]
MNRPTQGDEGGNGKKCLRASAVASVSKPANTVVIRSGRLLASNESFTPGRAAPAAHPQTELTTTKTVPFELMAASTYSALRRSSKPADVSSSFIGITNCSGYIV